MLVLVAHPMMTQSLTFCMTSRVYELLELRITNLGPEPRNLLRKTLDLLTLLRKRSSDLLQHALDSLGGALSTAWAG